MSTVGREVGALGHLYATLTVCLVVLLLTHASPRSVSAIETGKMVKVPAGKAMLGCNPEVDNECEEDEKPGGVVELPAFEIDVTEVTVGQYKACVEARGCSAQGVDMPSTGTEDQPDLTWTCNWGKPDRGKHPMNCLSWEAASAYCKWAKKRLPSAQEWERSARGTDGRRYPWGNDAVKTTPQANLADNTLLDNKPGGWGLAEFNDGYVSTAPVGSFSAGDSPVGAKDMAGNVWEFVTDGNDSRHEMRGGSWSYYPIALRASDRAFAPNGRRNGDTGFRCARGETKK